MYTAAIVTLSDKGYAGEREDRSGQRLKELLTEHSYQVVSYRLLPDDAKLLQEELVRLCAKGNRELLAIQKEILK